MRLVKKTRGRVAAASFVGGAAVAEFAPPIVAWPLVACGVALLVRSFVSTRQR